MSRSRFVLPLVVIAITATGAADLFHRAHVQGSMRRLQPPAVALLPEPPSPPPPPPRGEFP